MPAKNQVKTTAETNAYMQNLVESARLAKQILHANHGHNVALVASSEHLMQSLDNLMAAIQQDNLAQANVLQANATKQEMIDHAVAIQQFQQAIAKRNLCFATVASQAKKLFTTIQANKVFSKVQMDAFCLDMDMLTDANRIAGQAIAMRSQDKATVAEFTSFTEYARNRMNEYAATYDRKNKFIYLAAAAIVGVCLLSLMVFPIGGITLLFDNELSKQLFSKLPNAYIAASQAATSLYNLNMGMGWETITPMAIPLVVLGAVFSILKKLRLAADVEKDVNYQMHHSTLFAAKHVAKFAGVDLKPVVNRV